MKRWKNNNQLRVGNQVELIHGIRPNKQYRLITFVYQRKLLDLMDTANDLASIKRMYPDLDITLITPRYHQSLNFSLFKLNEWKSILILKDRHCLIHNQFKMRRNCILFPVKRNKHYSYLIDQFGMIRWISSSSFNEEILEELHTIFQ